MSLDITLIDKNHTVSEVTITHNLAAMAAEAGLHTAIWNPSELGAVVAGDIIKRLSAGLIELVIDPPHFRRFDAQNGWGTYDQFVALVARYLKACKDYPEAEIRVVG